MVLKFTVIALKVNFLLHSELGFLEPRSDNGNTKRETAPRSIVGKGFFPRGIELECLKGTMVLTEFIRYLLPVLFVLDGIDSAAGSRSQGVVKLGVLAESARVTQERVLLVIVDGSLYIET